MSQQHNKKKYSILICLFVIVGLFIPVACSKEEKNSDPEQVAAFADFSATKDGIYYTSKYENSETVLLKYYDKKSKDFVALCNKANCKHDNKECSAWILGEYKGRTLFMVCSYSDKLYLYYVDMLDESADVLMVADEDGANRKELYQIDKFSMINSAMIYHDKILMSCNTFGKIDEFHGGNTGTTLNVFDITENEFKQIAITKKEGASYLNFVGVKEDTAYYVYDIFADEHKPIYAYDLKNGKIDMVNDENVITQSTIYDDEMFYVDEDKNQIMAYNVFNKKTRKLTDFKPHEGKFTYHSSEGIVTLTYALNPTSKDIKLYSQAYDTKKGKFLFQDYVGNMDIRKRFGDSYLGYVSNESAIFDKNMKYKLYE